MSPADDYDPTEVPEAPATSSALGELLATIAQNTARPELYSRTGVLMGMPPYNDMYTVALQPNKDSFSMYNSVCSLQVDDQRVVVNGSETMCMTDFRKNVLEPALFSGSMGDTGVRVYFVHAGADGAGQLTILTGCNRQSVRCPSYTLYYRVA